MEINEIMAKHENLHKITLEEKKGVDEYVENVKKAVAIINNEIDSMMAEGATIDDIKKVLQEDLKQLNVDLRKLESLSEQLQEKADDYEEYLYILRGALE